MTDAGRWVHLMCALYTHGVSFGNVLALSNISLYEMDYRRYGSKVKTFEGIENTLKDSLGLRLLR